MNRTFHVNSPVESAGSPCDERELLLDEWPGELRAQLHLREDRFLSQPNSFFGTACMKYNNHYAYLGIQRLKQAHQ